MRRIKLMNKPEDHEERMTFTRSVAAWELGDATWADTLLEAYWDTIGDTGDDDE